MLVMSIKNIKLTRKHLNCLIHYNFKYALKEENKLIFKLVGMHGLHMYFKVFIYIHSYCINNMWTMLHHHHHRHYRFYPAVARFDSKQSQQHVTPHLLCHPQSAAAVAAPRDA